MASSYTPPSVGGGGRGYSAGSASGGRGADGGEGLHPMTEMTEDTSTGRASKREGGSDEYEDEAGDTFNDVEKQQWPAADPKDGTKDGVIRMPVKDGITRTPSAIAKEKSTLKKRKFWKKLFKYKWLKLLQVLLALYIAILSFAPPGSLTFINSDVAFGGFFDPVTRTIHDAAIPANDARGVVFTRGTERAITALNDFQIVCIAVTRVTAFFMYPCLILVFTTKMRALMGWLASTPFELFLFEDMHDLHVYCGYVIFVDSCLHTIGHIARFADQGNMHLLVEHFSGISGILIVIATLIVCIPMTFLREKIKYEIRKYMHYWFILFAVALCYHTPRSAMPNGGFSSIIFGALIIIWALDAAYVYFFMTEKIETTQFQVLPTGMQVTMRVSERFASKGDGGYAYVCFPWVDRSQWHAFSLFENPLNPMERQIFMITTGDWTQKVHETLQRDTRRPIWVQGPFPSPYSNAVDYDNNILVASGIGITPALSVIRAHKSTRRTNLIWVTRDAAMLEFFLEHAYLDHNGWNLIFYTGKDPLLNDTIDQLTSTNICVIRSRPNLAEVIPNIIYGIESKKGLPESYLPNKKQEAVLLLAEKLEEIEEDDPDITAEETVFELSRYALENGYLFTELIRNIGEEEGGDGKKTDSSPSMDRQTSFTILNSLRDNAQRMSTRDVLQPLRAASKPIVGATPRRQASNQPGGSRAPPSRLGSNAPGVGSLAPPPRRLGSHQPSTMRWRASRRNIGGGGGRQPVAFGSPKSRVGGYMSMTPHKTHQDTMEIAFQPWKHQPMAQDFVHALPESVKSTYGMLYCGGSAKLEESLQEVAEEYHLELYTESFKW